MRRVTVSLCVMVLTPCLTVAGAGPDASRQAELFHLLKHDCGSCHGMTRKGGLGPPLLPSALQDKPAQMIVSTVLDGRPGTAMPPWRDFLSEAEARWLVKMLLDGAGL